MMNSSQYYKASGIVQSNDCYVRLATLVNYAGRELYLSIFHDSNYGGFSTNGQQLYKELKLHETKLKSLKEHGLISNEDYQVIFPPSKETNSLEFDMKLFHVLSEHCVENFPMVQQITQTEGYKQVGTYLDVLQKVQEMVRDGSLLKATEEEFNTKWDEITSILESAQFDIHKVEDMRTSPLDDNKRYRVALIRAEIDLLLNECDEIERTAQTNVMALEKLILNFNEVIYESEEIDYNKNARSDKHLQDLKDRVNLTTKMLGTIRSGIQDLLPDIKHWKEKNIEGDIIVFDEKLNKVKNQVSEQGCAVGELFSGVSLDIVKIKEKLNLKEDNVKYFKRPIRSTSFLDIKSSLQDLKNL